MASRFLNGIDRNPNFSDQLIKLIPKTDIHCHLDGSIRLETLVDLAKEQNVSLPSYNLDELRNTVFKECYTDLDDYLVPFQYSSAVLRNANALERVAFEVAEDCYSEGVRYFEVRFAPHLNAVPGELSVEDVIIAVNKGLKRATDTFNGIDDDVHKGEAPEYMYGIIVCGMRFFNGHFSPFFKHFCEIFKYESKKKMFGIATLQLVKLAVHMRDTLNIPIVALDIAGSEASFPAINHAEAFQYAHENHMNKTIHAGEAYGPESIFQAVTACYAERIGHGLNMFDTSFFHPETPVVDKQKYVDGIIRFIANRRICVEVCLTSNYQTAPKLRAAHPNTHPLKRMMEEKLCVCLNTDNRLVSRTTMCDEIRLAVDVFKLSRDDLWELISNGFRSSFMPGSYANKLEYMRKMKAFYNRIIDMCNTAKS